MLLGATAGVLSGLLGIGGGIILVPALVLLVGLTQQEAQGTTLIFLTAPFGLPRSILPRGSRDQEPKVTRFRYR